MTFGNDLAVLECSKLMMVVYRVIIMTRLLNVLYDIPLVLVASQHTRFAPRGALKSSSYFTLHDSLFNVALTDIPKFVIPIIMLSYTSGSISVIFPLNT